MIKILEKLQVGCNIYSPLFGKARVCDINDKSFLVIEHESYRRYYFDEYGRLHSNGECVIFPSEDNRDWALVNSKPAYEMELTEPDPVYWFRVTNDEAKNAFLFAKLQELTGKDKLAWSIPSEGMIWFTEKDGLSCFQSENKIARMAMMVGKEITIK